MTTQGLPEKVLQKRCVQQWNGMQALPLLEPTIEGQIMGFRPEDLIQANFKQCIRPGNDT